MKIECMKEKLGETIASAARFSGKHPTLPVLSAFLCEAKQNTLLIRATNLDIGIEITIPVKVFTEGSVAIPAQIITQTISAIQGKQVLWEEKDGNILLSSGSYKTIVKCVPKDDFPTIPAIIEGDEVEIQAKKFAEGIEAVVYSASVSEIKPELSSVYIYPEQNMLVFVSTDSFRLAEKKIPIKGIKDFPGIIIPYKNAIEIARVCSTTPDSLRIVFNKHHISFSSNSFHITSRLIEGTFPDYKQIIPKEEKTRVVALKQDFVQAVKATAVFANKFNQLSIKVKPEDTLFSINSKNSDIGEISVSLDAAISGDSVEMNVNTRYFSDCLAHIHQDSVALLFNGPGRPIIISGASDTLFTYLVMPMNK